MSACLDKQKQYSSSLTFYPLRLLLWPSLSPSASSFITDALPFGDTQTSALICSARAAWSVGRQSSKSSIHQSSSTDTTVINFVTRPRTNSAHAVFIQLYLGIWILLSRRHVLASPEINRNIKKYFPLSQGLFFGSRSRLPLRLICRQSDLSAQTTNELR